MNKANLLELIQEDVEYLPNELSHVLIFASPHEKAVLNLSQLDMPLLLRWTQILWQSKKYTRLKLLYLTADGEPTPVEAMLRGFFKQCASKIRIITIVY